MREGKKVREKKEMGSACVVARYDGFFLRQKAYPCNRRLMNSGNRLDQLAIGDTPLKEGDINAGCRRREWRKRRRSIKRRRTRRMSFKQRRKRWGGEKGT